MERYIREGSFKNDLSLLDTLQNTLDSLELFEIYRVLDDFSKEELKVYKDTVDSVKQQIKKLS